MVDILPLPERPEGGVLIRDAAVVTVDDAFTVHDPGWVFFVGETIAAVGPGEPPADLVEGAGQVVDGAGHAVMPGMTNGHTHLFQTFFRGLADDKPLLDWLRECIWPGAVHLDADAAYLAGLVGMIENLRTGATAVLDHQYVHVDPEIDDAICRAADNSGVRYLLARGWADRNYPGIMCETAEEILEHTEGLRERWHGHDADRAPVPARVSAPPAAPARPRRASFPP